MKHRISLFAILLFSLSVVAQTKITISNPEEWTVNELKPYVGSTVTFLTPMIVCNNYNYSSSRLTISPVRTFSPTNQALPLSTEYDYLLQHNPSSQMTLNGVNTYHRMGERIVNLTVKVNSLSSLTVVGTPKFVGNTRDDVGARIPSVDMKGVHTLLVCAFNLEYYLVENIGTGYGADDATESARQHAKIMEALTKIRADVFGFVEIEQGQAALRKLAQSLTTATGKQYSFINDGGSSNGSFTKSGYVYCTETVEPVGELRKNNSQYSNRKMMQAFREKATGEVFIFSLNHFKAKSGTGTGLNADQGDGQGIFNYNRTLEAQSVLNQYATNRTYYQDEDILIMGDLNAYAMEDPIQTLVNGGMKDLHRYFHADSSYSYVFHDQAGYLDHALANSTLLPQVTGMVAWHINSDEHDRFTYDKSNDQTMFRSSDHDPVLVGLRLGNAQQQTDVPHVNNYEVSLDGSTPQILYAAGGYYRIHDLSGNLIEQGTIDSDVQPIQTALSTGLYIITIYANNTIQPFKLLVR